VGRLLPSIVDIIHQDSTDTFTGTHWRLSQVGGTLLDESMTLDENEIRDGTLLLLTAVEPPAPEWVVCDPSHAVAQTAHMTGVTALRLMSVFCCLFLSAAGAAALVWSAAPTATAGHLMTASGPAVAAALAAVVTCRIQPDPALITTLCVVAVAYTAVAGFLAVPAGAPLAHVLLAAAAALSMAIVLLRLIDSGTICLTAIATFTLLVAAVAAAGVAWHFPPVAVGAGLATASLATMGVAPRLAIRVAGVGPSMPSVDDPDGPFLECAAADRAAHAHRTLTGLVTGASSSASVGCAVVAFGDPGDGPSFDVVTFILVIGLILILRTRTHADAVRRIALTTGGMISASALFASCVVSMPEQVRWLSLLAAATGFAALSRFFGPTIGPIASRTVELVEYVALAAVVPVACWVSGLFGMVRGLSLI